MKKFILFALLCTAFVNARNSLETLSQTYNLEVNCSEVEVVVVFDSYPTDISWRIENESGNVFLSGKDYKQGASNVSEKVCLEDGVYTFIIDDSYGDGLCCRYGNGKYEVNFNGVALVSGATFTSNETKSFTIGQAVPPPTPTNLQSSNVTSNSVDLTWETQGTVQSTTTFDVYNNNQVIKSVKGVKTATLTGLTPETVHEFSVRAKNINGDLSSFSNKINVKTLKDVGGDFPLEMKELLALVNKERAADGKTPLTMNTKLVAAAVLHAKDMSDNNFMSHTGSNGSNVGQRVTDQGYSWNRVGENIARGYSTVQQVHDGWMNSSGHKANILNANYTEIGLAREANYWVQVFGRSSNALLASKSLESQIVLYPTVLSSGQSEVYIQGHDVQTTYSIYAMSGCKINQGKVVNNKMVIDNLSSGMYLVHLETENMIVAKRIFVK